MATTNQITVDSEHESKLASWLATRGGIAVWINCDLGSPGIGGQSYTPAIQADGTPATSPHWRNGNKPAFVITEPAQVLIQTAKEVTRVKVRRGPPCFGGINRADKDKLRAAMDKAGDGAFYTEDFSNMQYGSAWFEAVIFTPTEIRQITMP